MFSCWGLHPSAPGEWEYIRPSIATPQGCLGRIKEGDIAPRLRDVSLVEEEPKERDF